MKLPNLFHPKPEPDNSTPIDFSIPRRCFHHRFDGEPGSCPQCGKPLYQHTQTYLVATRRGTQMTDTFIMSNDAGWFCAACPTVVIDANDLGETLAFPKPGWDSGVEFAVLGIIDLDAIPPEQRSLPFDQVDPLPLTPFNTTSQRSKPSQSNRQSGKRTRSKHAKKSGAKKKRH